MEVLLYFFGYKKKFFFFFQDNLENLDPSFDRCRSLGLFRKDKTCIIAKFHRTD